MSNLTSAELSQLSEEQQLELALKASKLSLEEDKLTGSYKRHAKVSSFIDWIHANFKSKSNQREMLLKIFGRDDWEVIDPVGDGFCTIYAAFIDQGLLAPSGKD